MSSKKLRNGVSNVFYIPIEEVFNIKEIKKDGG